MMNLLLEVGTGVSHGKVTNADNTVLETVTEPGLVDNGKASYASKVAGVQAKNNKANPSLFGEEVVVGEEDVLVDQSGLIPSIMFSDQVLNQVDYSMRNALIVRLLGKVIGFKALHARVHSLWKPVNFTID
ncbi:hypothetical protein GQ457_01G013750 [Hibiscus cannabinus]